jgi:molecular chaperone DnaK (HSP70)
LRTARLSAREMKKELFTTGKTSLKTGGLMATTIRINELMEDQSFRTYLTALRNTMAASLNIVLQRAEAVGANVVDVVLAGGGSNLPFMGDLVRSAGQVRQHNITLRAGPLSPANPLYNSVDVGLRDVFPQISMSVGGALVEMMPAR